LVKLFRGDMPAILQNLPELLAFHAQFLGGKWGT
jgi:hypothetical protein